MDTEDTNLTISDEEARKFRLHFPTLVGVYKLDTISFGLTYKPSWFHRKMMKLCLGWEWVDVE